MTCCPGHEPITRQSAVLLRSGIKVYRASTCLEAVTFGCRSSHCGVAMSVPASQSDRNQKRGLACSAFNLRISVAEGPMQRRFLSPIKSVALVAALVVSGTSLDVQANRAYANDCVASPNASAPQGQHWYYHIDRPNHRKCWHATLPTAREVAPRENQRARTRTAAKSEMDHITRQVRAAPDGATPQQTNRWETTRAVKVAPNTGSDDALGDQHAGRYGHDGVMNDQERDALFDGFLAWQKARRLDADTNSAPSGGQRSAVMNDQEKEALFQAFSAWQKAQRLNADTIR